ncbi:MAG: Nif3-like dinuclear metal center hexameric protein [Myxococcales bacterium]|nr:Nif3-like dinuclear metal center hexameric protein [Myxococcales bacterium]
MKRQDFLKQLNEWLLPENFKDMAENGLQVEGAEDVTHVVCGVSANQKLIQAAIDKKADAIFVHHGIVWGGGMRQLTGWLGKRVKMLMSHDINLFAYHLPLDAQPAWGNNAGLADALGMSAEREPFGVYKGKSIGFKGAVTKPMTLADMVKQHEAQVGKTLQVFGDLSKPIRHFGVCTGGAQDRLSEAIDDGLDLYVTGEATEWVKAMAEESGVAFIAGGHHNTEVFGARSFSCQIASLEGVTAEFVDIPNPA